MKGLYNLCQVIRGKGVLELNSGEISKWTILLIGHRGQVNGFNNGFAAPINRVCALNTPAIPIPHTGNY